MLLGYSSIGQPTLSLSQCDALAKEFALDFLELRVVEGSLDLPDYFQTRNPDMPAIPVRVLASSLRLIDAASTDLEEFSLFGELAHRLQTPYVRVFGGGREGDALTFHDFHRAESAIRQIRHLSRQNGWCFEILIETHGAFSFPRNCILLNLLLREPVLVLWDSHHTWKYAGESPEKTWKQIGHWVRHVHYKDSKTGQSSFEYVLPGTGDFPTKSLFELLRKEGYSTGVSLEWEKLWHPELPLLSNALKAFLEITRPKAPTPSSPTL